MRLCNTYRFRLETHKGNGYLSGCRYPSTNLYRSSAELKLVQTVKVLTPPTMIPLQTLKLLVAVTIKSGIFSGQDFSNCKRVIAIKVGIDCGIDCGFHDSENLTGTCKIVHISHAWSSAGHNHMVSHSILQPAWLDIMYL